jgi:hypothetical protein
MDRQAEIEVMAAVLVMLQEADLQEPDGTYVLVSRRTLGFIADRFRTGGVDPHANAFGRLTQCSKCETPLDPEKGELFAGEDGEPYCNDHFPKEED